MSEAPRDRWEEVTVRDMNHRNGPLVKRLAVPGGWLYWADAYESRAPVYVPNPRDDQWQPQS